MIVTAAQHAGAGLGLVLVEDGQHTEDDRDAGVELDAHEAVRNAVGDVLEVHSLALDEHTNGDDGVENGGAGVGGGERSEVGRGAAEEVARS